MRRQSDRFHFSQINDAAWHDCIRQKKYAERLGRQSACLYAMSGKQSFHMPVQVAGRRDTGRKCDKASF